VGQADASIHVPVSLAEVWGLYFDQPTWPTWVDGFGGVDLDQGYPEAGGTLQWHSNPSGRGKVAERVLEHEPRRVHRVSFRDQYAEGEMTVRFEIDGEGTRVTQEVSYRVLGGGPLGPLTDRLFIRSQVRGSLARSLERLRREAEDLAAR
jgi:Polyketide cyclase / dehydrase and lipid transport